MFKKIYRWSVALSCLAMLLTATLFGVVFYLTTARSEAAQLETDLQLVQAGLKTNGKEFLEQLSGTQSLEQNFRVTLISTDGTVTFDSWAPAGSLGNHKNREEVRQAITQGSGQSHRYSVTQGQITYYAAQRLENGQILRLSRTQDMVWITLARWLPGLGALLVVVALVSLWAARTVARRISDPIIHINLDEPLPAAPETYSELLPLLERIDQQNQAQARTEQYRREFTANVTHELKTPLHAIMGNAELLQSGLVRPGDEPEFAGQIYTEATRLLALINDVLRLSRMEESDSFAPEKVELAPLVEQTLSRLENTAASRGITLRFSGAARVWAVPSLVNHIVQNLIDNALAYNMDGGWVSVEMREERCAGEAVVDGSGGLVGGSAGSAGSEIILGADTNSSGKRTKTLEGSSAGGANGKVVANGAVGGPAVGGWGVLCVRDSGVGIPAEAQDRIFERFYRVDASHSSATGGTGLGLAIVKHAVEVNGGTISLSSQVGEGTEIIVRLPLAS